MTRLTSRISFGSCPRVRSAARQLAKMPGCESIKVPGYPLEECDQLLEWINADDIEGLAMRRFCEDFPLLAGLACHGTKRFDAARRRSTVEEAYGFIIDEIVTEGLVGEHDEHPTGGIPRSVLEKFRGVALRMRDFDSYHTDLRMANILRMLRRLPADFVPATALGLLNVERLEYFIESLECNEGTNLVGPGVLEGDHGFAIPFTNAELASLLAPLAAQGFSELPENVAKFESHEIAMYGAKLAGFEAQASDFVSGNTDEMEAFAFTLLKQALLDEGVFTVCQKARDYCKQQDDAPEAPSFR
jgi:hypothetical protein